MKNLNVTIVFILIILLIGGFLVFWSDKKEETNVPPSTEQVSSITGCYAVRFMKDVYTLNISSQTGEDVSGTIAFKNFEKDSSSGTFTGTYHAGILFGDYSFQSEGMNSVMQVIFRRLGDDFVRGYGEVDAEGTHFKDINTVTYDASSPLSVFKKEVCSPAV